MGTYDDDGQRVIALSVDGEEVTRDDEHWEGVVKDWEEEGVDPDLVELARPLLEGTVAQQKAARRVLSAARGNHRADDESVGKINLLLAEAGLADSPTDLSGLYDLAVTGESLANVEDQEDAVLAAWGQQYPDQQRQEERYWPGGHR